MTTRPTGTWRRFFAALLAFVGFAMGIPAALVVVGRLAVGSGNPLPGVGSTSEIRAWFERELSTTEVVPVVLRSLITVSWILWALLVSSVLSALVATRPALGHLRIPRLAMFDGLGTWIAAGLTVLSSIAPKVALADSTVPPVFATPAPVDQSTASDPVRSTVPVAPGHERVETGESIEMFAERTLGDGARWTEIWELGRGTVVDPVTGATWDEPWRLEGGWQLELPATRSTGHEPLVAAVGDPTTPSPLQLSTRLVEPGDSYWSISTDLLLNHLDREPSDAETLRLTDALIDRNSERLGHSEAPMLHPGDVLDIDVDIDAPPVIASADEHVVEAGDSYWSIATQTLWATNGERPAEADVFLLTQQLMLDNAERLGYGDPSELHPGDIVRLLPETAKPPTAAPDLSDDDPHGSDGPTPSPTDDAAPQGEVEQPPTAHQDALDPPVADSPPAEVPSPADVAAPQVHTAPQVGPATEQSPEPRPLDRPSGPPAPVASPSDEPPATAETDRSIAPVGVLTGLSVLAAASVASLIRKRYSNARQRLRPGRRLANPSPTTRAALNDVLYRDVSEVTWMDHELRLLAHHLEPSARRRMTIELVQLGDTRSLEVAFKEVTEVAPPGKWTSVADRVWRLEEPHEDQQLADVQDAPPIAPSLVTVGAPTGGGQIYFNLESAAGVNVSGDDETVHEWLANALWEIAGNAVGEGSEVWLVADAPLEGLRVPEGVERISEADALELVLDTIDIGTGGEPPSMLDRRTGRWEAWPSSTLLLVGESTDERWDHVAAAPSVAVLSMTHRFQSGLDVMLRDGTISIPALGIDQPAAALTAAEQLTIEGVMEAVDSAETEVSTEVPAPQPSAPMESPQETDEDWDVPTWPVIVNVLGAPRATKNGTPIKLTPQQLSALALIAMKREIPAHDFRRSIWGDEDDVSPERVRDMLSQLRKKVGGLRVIPKREDGLVCAGDDLGSDTLVMEALLDRAAAVPAERMARLGEALDLVSGRVMDYSSIDSAWWRWSEIAFGATDWTAKTTDVAASLAHTHLENSNPAAARDVAERGLVADPLNASLTELLMEAYADLGALESARRVYESHDRSLDMADLGGASAETRRVLERLRKAADRTAAKAKVS